MGEFLESDKKDSNLSMDILRQRRNLMLISVLMPLFFLSGASIDKISLLGTEIIIKNSGYIDIFIFILFFYFWWRYWQYFRADVSAKFLKDGIKNNRYDQEIKYFKSKIEPKVLESFESVQYMNLYFENYTCDGCKAPKMTKDKRNGGFRNKIRVIQVNFYGYLNTQVKQIERVLCLRKLPDKIDREKVILNTGQSFKEDRVEPLYELYVKYNAALLWLLRVKWEIQFVFSERIYSDYILPIVIASASAFVTAAYLFKLLA